MAGAHHWRSSLGVAAVAFGGGVLFATNASLFAEDDQRAPTNLAELAAAETERLEQLEAENAELRAERDALLAGLAEPPTQQDEQLVTSVGRSAVRGPGVEVQLWDAPDVGTAGVNVDDLVVHQQDLEAVMNALWAGGAEAMTVQGQRIVTTSGVRCVGNTLYLHGRTYSPPFVVQAIGDPAALTAALESSPGVQVYQQYVDAYGLGWSQTRLEEIEMPAYGGSMELQHGAPAPGAEARGRSEGGTEDA